MSAHHEALIRGCEALRSRQYVLRELLQDEGRNAALFLQDQEIDVCMDLSRQLITSDMLEHLLSLTEEKCLAQKIDDMFAGKAINVTENRAVLHVALRGKEDDHFMVDGRNVMSDIYKVLGDIEKFSEGIRKGSLKGFTGKALTSVVCIGIGGSYLGPESVVEALKTYPETRKAARGRILRFLANVDPIDVERALMDLDPETTLVVVISKTFTTAETMLNAKTVRKWLIDTLKDEKAVAKHMAAVSTNIPATTNFGINPEYVFGFWDWVGGRYSVCSAVGALPIALQFGFGAFKEFLEGCRAMDNHFRSKPAKENMPLLMGLLAYYNSTYLKTSAVAVLPYCQALHRFPAHVQQVMMESNGKRVTRNGEVIDGATGEIFFGEPGTNGQHSFYQLLHQGRVVPADFIGFKKSQTPIQTEGHPVSNHDELMSNYFAQPDALAIGKTPEECSAEKVPQSMIPHKVFSGDRPSTMTLMPICSPFYVGVLMSLYENRTAVEGFLWDVNPFDQFGVQLGKVLATSIRNYFQTKRKSTESEAKNDEGASFIGPTKRMLSKFLA